MTKDYSKIDWGKALSDLRELQDLLVMAYRKGDKLLVAQLQRKIVCSFAARSWAVRSTIHSLGGKNSGTDGEIWKESKDIFKGIIELKHWSDKPNDYKAKALKKIFVQIPGSTEKRPLYLPTILDRCMQKLYYYCISPIVEDTSDPNSYGYRSMRSEHDAISKYRTLLDKDFSPDFVLNVGIHKKSEALLKSFLMENTPIPDKNPLKSWLDSGIISHIGQFEEDSSQNHGGILSPVLLNIALDGFEGYVKTKARGIHKALKKREVLFNLK
jgi:RNA-directed DNA polymerase